MFIVVALGVWWLSRNQRRFGGGQGYGIDPVCGMQVRVADAPASATHNDRAHYFCSDRCKKKFEADPAQYSRKGAQADEMTSANRPGSAQAVDPVCGMTVDPTTAAAHRVRAGQDIWFCNVGCAEQFDRDPRRFVDVT